MNDIIEIKKETLEQLKNSYAKYYQFEKIDLDKKKIAKLRKKITTEKKEGYTYLLRVISLYTQKKDEHLKIYISKLYLEHFEN